MKKILTHLFAVLLLSFVTTSAWAQFENGKVYRIVCSGTNSVSLGASALTDVAAVSTSETEKAQQWYVTVSGSNYTFRNLANGRYLLGNNSTSNAWGLTETSNDFTVTAVNGNYAIRGASHTNGYGYMHKDGGNNIVSWESGAANSQWTPIEVSYTADELQAVWEEVESLVVPSATVVTYEGYLAELFSDKSCVTPALATLDAAKATDAYKNLPAALQKMVDKVYGGDWSEKTVAPADRPNGNNNTNHNLWTVADTWDNDYAKKFRVQMYEPYSVEGEITNYLRINAHCNMDNPTGIYANAGEPMYIMVEGTIAEGAELWVAHQVGHGATNYYNNAAYTQLKEGLNVVPYFADGSQLWINYLVHTYNANEKTIEEKFPHKLSEYKPLKIHIEGGKINGFFNAMGDYRATTDAENLWGDVDNDADWNYYKVRAALSGDFALLGHRQTLLFDFGTYNSTKKHFGVANADGGIEYALAYHLENIEVPTTPNCYAGSGNAFGNYSDTYYPGMQLSATTGKINIMLEAWDRIQYSEHASLGLLSVANIEKMNALYPRWSKDGKAAEIYNYGSATVNGETKTYKDFCQGIDYSDYFNHHGAAVGAGSGYMSGGWRVCNYHYNTMGSIIGKIAVEPGPTWGPAHEIGHQHQTIFNLNGQTEVTNNFHSNVAVWYMGMGTSRYNGGEGNLEHVLGAYNTDGNDLYTNNIWALTHLYYRLWLYYHLAGNNTQFWPRLFELLRQVPIVNGGQISGETSLLRFYQHACDAAGEDLTEFFRAHGFFELMTDRLVGDYSNGTYNVTEEQIETAISTIKAKNYPVNYAVLLINDGTSETTVKHDGTTARALWDNNPSAELGSVNDFIDGETSVTDAYEAVVSADGTVTMSGGTGGVGFLILNEKGEIVSFSNKASFQISDEAAYLLATGKASVVAVDAESTKTESEVDLSAIQREMLKALINKVEAMPIDDGSYTHVGFYTKASAEELLAVLESAKTAYEGNSGYGAAYEMLYTAKEKLVNSENNSYVPFDPSLTYVITNCAYSGKTMHLNNGLKSATGVDQTAKTARWQFKTTDTEGVYKLYNTAGYYLTAPAKSATVGSTATVDDAATFTLLQESPVGAWSISLSPAAEYTTLHDNSYGNVVGWSAGVDPSKWYLTAVANSNSASLVAADELQALIAKTETLVDLVSEISYTFSETPVALQVNDASGDYYVRTNATNTGGSNEGPIANLVDNNLGNYFHTQYANSAKSDDDLDHYIEVSMGSGALSAFRFSYTTRSGVYNDYPQIIKVYGSNTENKEGDESEYTLLATVSSGLPASNTQTTYTYPTAIDAGIAYKYLRFMVPTTNKNRVSDGSEHNYWHMAEFDISEATATAELRTDYSSISAEIVLAAYNAANAAKSWVNYEKLTDDQLSAAKSNLETAYKNLKDAYDDVIKDKQEELEALADATDLVIKSVGTVELGVETPFEPTASNFYCNSVDGDGGATADNKYNLADGKESTYLHTKTNNHTGEDSYGYHYLRVDLGDGVTTENFMFTYQNRTPSSYTVFPSVLTIQGSNDNSEYVDIVEISSGLPNTAGGTYESEVLGNGNAYRYFRFVVKSTHANRSTPNYFCMAEFSFTAVEERKITINQEYKNIVSEDLLYSTYNTSGDSHLMAAETSHPTLAQLEAQITKLTEAKATLEAAMNNVDKAALQSLYVDALELYNEMADAEGNVKAYYESSALTNEKLIEVKAALDAAKEMLDNGISQTEIDAAKNALQAQYDALLEIKNSDVTGRDELNELIGDMQSLLGEVADKTTAKTALVLQTTDEDDSFYIWSNAKASDCDGIGASALIDKNDDGTAKTGTFFGTVWQGGAVPNYSHYITVDLGTEIALNELSIDYTTRNSTHSNQRPTAIKVLGSNDKEGEYVEITHLSEGMPVGQCAKWEMTSTVALDNLYRYIRFAPATEVGYFNMSDFNLYAHSAVKANDNYSTSDITTAQLYAMNAALLDGIAARDNYVTEENYNTALAALRTQYNALLEIKNANVSDRTSLEDLITQTNPLIEEVATVSEEEAAIAMQCTDVNAPYYLYCNADGTETNGSGDKLGVTALLDNDANTHLHTTYGNNAQDDNLDHYLRLDMGKNEAMMSFKFSYTGRSSNSNNDPSTMVIEGCNTLDGEWAEIVTLTGLPTDGDGVQYNSELIESDKAYRYIRFMVTKTQNGSTNNGHPFFVLSKFSVTACKTIEVKTEYVSPNLPLSTLVTANNEVVDATVIKNQFYVTETVYDTTEEELQAAYDALNLAKNLKELPVILTTDVNNPVLYKIQIKSNENVFTYKGETADASKKPVLAASELGNRYQAWYFMQGTNSESYEDILILPYFNEGEKNTTLRLSYANNNDGTDPAVVASGTNTTDNWYITFTSEGNNVTTEGWWNLQPEGGMDAEVNAFVNQYGGTNSTRLAFWRNASNPSNNGSQFRFVLDETDYSLSDAYYALYNQHASYSDIEAGTEVGAYTQATVDVFNTEFDEAKTLLEAKNSTDDEYNTAREQLVAAYEALEINMPDPVKYYVLRCNHEDRYIYVNADNKLQWAASSYDKAQSRAVWQFEEIDASNGTCKMKSLHTMSYLNQLVDDQWTFDEETGKVVTIVKSPTVDGAVIFKIEGHANEGLHAHGANNRVIAHTNEAGANHYFFEEVEVVTGIKHDVTMNTKFSSVTLGYNATVPAGVEAYNAVGLEGGYVTLVKVAGEGEVIPANTPVILYRTDGNSEAKTFTFTYTDKTAEKPASTLLGGSLYTKYVQCDDSDYYKLMIKNGEAKMYLMYKEFNAQGVSQGATHAGGHIKCSANKIYMRVPGGNEAAVYSMRFIGSGVTGIDGVNAEDAEGKTIYDLQGRKLTEITEPGFYIVDGKKVYVK